MSISVGNAKTDNGSLVLAVDAANPKTYFSSASRNHGLSEWYCLVSSNTVSYATPEPNTIIYERTPTGSVSVKVPSTITPARGIISIIAGYTYYADKPVQFVAEDGAGGVCIAPLTMAGTLFMHYNNRGNPGTVYFYSPYAPTTISFYDAAITGNGINGTVTSTLTLAKGQQGTISLPNLNWSYFKSTAPVLGAVGQTGSDYTLLNPVETIMYNRYAGASATVIGTTPTTVGAYVTADTTYPVMNQTIADGAGGDTMQALGISYLSDTYVYGNSLSDYAIVAPYPNSVVSVSYWNGSTWVLLESHSLSGTELNPAQVQRDGSAGVGVTATNLSGGVANFASNATGPWRFVGNNPFLVGINDTQDDELPLLGWMSSSNLTRLSSSTTGTQSISSVGNIAGVPGCLMYGNRYSTTSNGTFYQDGVTGYISIPHTPLMNVGENFTISAWVNTRDTNNRYGVFSTRTDNSTGSWQLEIGSGSLTPDGSNPGRVAVTGLSTWIFESFRGVIANNTWYHICWVKTDSTVLRGGTMYVNGVSQSPLQVASYTILDNTSDKCIGAGTARGQQLPGSIGNVEWFNKALTAAEVSSLFNALRARYGI